MKKKHWDWLKIELDKLEHKSNIDYFLTTTYFRPNIVTGKQIGRAHV